MDVWSWAVTYNDGSYYAEEELGTFANVDTERVTRLDVFLKEHPPYMYSVKLHDGMRPIVFQRSKQVIDLDTGNQWNEYICTCFGWQKTVEGKNVKSLTWLFPDGSVAVTDCDIDEL